MCSWVSGCVHIVTFTEVSLKTIGILVLSMMSWVSVMIFSSVVVSVMRLMLGFVSMSVFMMWGTVTKCGV